jgi:hypothetical protein
MFHLCRGENAYSRATRVKICNKIISNLLLATIKMTDELQKSNIIIYNNRDLSKKPFSVKKIINKLRSS